MDRAGAPSRREILRIQATIDVDLRNLAKLEAVMSVVETAGIAPEGCGMWTRDGPEGLEDA